MINPKNVAACAARALREMDKASYEINFKEGDTIGHHWQVARESLVTVIEDLGYELNAIRPYTIRRK